MANFKVFAVILLVFAFIIANNLNADEVQQTSGQQINSNSVEDKGSGVARTEKQDINSNVGEKETVILEDKQQLDSTQKSVEEGAKPLKNFEYRDYNSFGLNISSHSGIGLSYRYHTSAPFLFQATGGVIASGKSYFYAVGGEIQRELSKSKDKRAFGAFATGIYGKRYEETDYDVGYTGLEPPKKWKSDINFSFAIGVGGELALGNSTVDAISLGIEIYPIGVYISNESKNSFNMFPGGAIYLFYNF